MISVIPQIHTWNVHIHIDEFEDNLK